MIYIIILQPTGDELIWHLYDGLILIYFF